MPNTTSLKAQAAEWIIDLWTDIFWVSVIGFCVVVILALIFFGPRIFGEGQ